MKTIKIKFTDVQAREIGYFLRKLYQRDRRTGLDRLCKIAIFREIQKQAKEDILNDESAAQK